MMPTWHRSSSVSERFFYPPSHRLPWHSPCHRLCHWLAWFSSHAFQRPLDRDIPSVCDVPEPGRCPKDAAAAAAAAFLLHPPNDIKSLHPPLKCIVDVSWRFLTQVATQLNATKTDKPCSAISVQRDNVRAISEPPLSSTFGQLATFGIDCYHVFPS